MDTVIDAVAIAVFSSGCAIHAVRDAIVIGIRAGCHPGTHAPVHVPDSGAAPSPGRGVDPGSSVRDTVFVGVRDDRVCGPIVVVLLEGFNNAVLVAVGYGYSFQKYPSL